MIGVVDDWSWVYNEKVNQFSTSYDFLKEIYPSVHLLYNDEEEKGELVSVCFSMIKCLVGLQKYRQALQFIEELFEESAFFADPFQLVKRIEDKKSKDSLSIWFDETLVSEKRYLSKHELFQICLIKFNIVGRLVHINKADLNTALENSRKLKGQVSKCFGDTSKEMFDVTYEEAKLYFYAYKYQETLGVLYSLKHHQYSRDGLPTYRLVVCMIKLKRYNEALEVCNRAHESIIRHTGIEDYRNFKIQFNKGVCLRESGKIKEAKSLAKEYYLKCKSEYGDLYWLTLYLKRLLAECLLYDNKYKKAKMLYEELYDYYKERCTDNHFNVVDIEYNLAKCYLKLNEREKGKNHLFNVYDKEMRMYGSEHPKTLLTKDRIADCLFHENSYDEAKSKLEEFVNLYAQRYDVDTIDIIDSEYSLEKYYFEKQ